MPPQSPTARKFSPLVAAAPPTKADDNATEAARLITDSRCDVCDILFFVCFVDLLSVEEVCEKTKKSLKTEI